MASKKSKKKGASKKKPASAKKGGGAAKKGPAKSTAGKKAAGEKAAPRSGKGWLVGAGLAAVAVVGVVVFAQPRGGASGGGEGAEEIAEEVDLTEPLQLGTTVPEALRVEVVRRHPNDTDAFTQGLLWHDGELYESTGLEGRSTLRRTSVEGEVRQRVDVPGDFFAEGLARVGDRLFQLTWQSGKAFVYDRETFEKVAEHDYEGEGWGLCFDGEHLVMSDGSDRLAFRDPESFEVVREVRVTRIGRPLRRLNELECVDGAVYANVWQSDDIVRIDPATGAVTATIDASGLLTRAERRRTDVLNGIAWLPDRERFLITGKLWPWAFEVELVAR